MMVRFKDYEHLLCFCFRNSVLKLRFGTPKFNIKPFLIIGFNIFNALGHPVNPLILTILIILIILACLRI